MFDLNICFNIKLESLLLPHDKSPVCGNQNSHVVQQHAMITTRKENQYGLDHILANHRDEQVTDRSFSQSAIASDRKFE